MHVKLPAISPLKRVTPAGLMKTESPRQSVSPSGLARSSKFLTSREHRVFPVSLTQAGEESDEHDARLHCGKRESALRKSLDEAIMTVRLPAVKRTHQKNLSTVVREETDKTVKLPELRARQYAGGSGSPLKVKRRENDENGSCNSYKKLSRSPVKQAFESPQRATRGPKKPNLRVEAPSAAAEPHLTDTLESDASYEAPAITYGQKVQRIKKLAESTMRMLQV